MNAFDIILIALLLLWTVKAFLSIFKRKRKNGCCCGCSSCPNAAGCKSRK